MGKKCLSRPRGAAVKPCENWAAAGAPPLASVQLDQCWTLSSKGPKCQLCPSPRFFYKLTSGRDVGYEGCGQRGLRTRRPHSSWVQAWPPQCCDGPLSCALAAAGAGPLGAKESPSSSTSRLQVAPPACPSCVWTASCRPAALPPITSAFPKHDTFFAS